MADEFQWDEENTSHLARHGVSVAEFEQAIRNGAEFIIEELIAGEVRTLEVGHTDKGRILILLWVSVENGIRAITAYDATATTRRQYRKRLERRLQ